MTRLRTATLRAAAALGVLACITFWFLFDRMYPRIPARVFGAGEGLGLAVTVVLCAILWRRERDRGAAALLGVALLGAALYGLAAGLGLRWRP